MRTKRKFSREHRQKIRLAALKRWRGVRNSDSKAGEMDRPLMLSINRTVIEIDPRVNQTIRLS